MPKLLPVLAVSLILAGFLLAVPVWAVPPPMSGGQLMADPIGLKEIDVTRSTLNIDLRPLADGHKAHIEAVYRLNNPGPEKKLELLFPARPDSPGDIQVWLGNQAIPGELAEKTVRPADWKAPYARTLICSLVLPPGKHALKVNWEAEVAKNNNPNSDLPLVSWQFVYLMSPMRQAGSFKGLDVAVQVPENWHVETQPDLKTDGALYVGSFDDLPADTLKMKLQAPLDSNYERFVWAGRALFALTGLAGALICWRVGVALGRRRRLAWPWALGLSLLWAFALFRAGIFFLYGPAELAVPQSQLREGGFGSFAPLIGVAFATLMAPPIGFTICVFSAARAARGVKEEPPTSAQK
jgi:hypothetical protein